MSLVTAGGSLRDTDDPLVTGLDAVSPVLDEISFRYDLPLRVCQQFWVGIPSGTLNIQLPGRQPQETIDLCGGWISHEPIREGIALYREALSTADPFHQFLGFWKVQENVSKAQGVWCQRTGLPALKRVEERMPDFFIFGTYVGKKFGRVLQDLRKPYRVALAHGYVDLEDRPRTLARAVDYFAVARQVPLLRHIARVKLENFHRTLEAAVGARESAGG